jgi:hypothetical protein
MEDQSASGGGASEVQEIAAARDPMAEAKKDVKEAEDKVAAAKAEVAAAEARVKAAQQAVKQAGTDQEGRAEATTELQYAQDARQLAFDTLKSLEKSRAVREEILNKLLLQQSGAMQSHAFTGYSKAMPSLGFCLSCSWLVQPTWHNLDVLEVYVMMMCASSCAHEQGICSL